MTGDRATRRPSPAEQAEALARLRRAREREQERLLAEQSARLMREAAQPSRAPRRRTRPHSAAPTPPAVPELPPVPQDPAPAPPQSPPPGQTLPPRGVPERVPTPMPQDRAVTAPRSAPPPARRAAEPGPPAADAVPLSEIVRGVWEERARQRRAREEAAARVSGPPRDGRAPRPVVPPALDHHPGQAPLVRPPDRGVEADRATGPVRRAPVTAEAEAGRRRVWPDQDGRRISPWEYQRLLRDGRLRRPTRVEMLESGVDRMAGSEAVQWLRDTPVAGNLAGVALAVLRRIYEIVHLLLRFEDYLRAAPDIAADAREIARDVRETLWDLAQLLLMSPPELTEALVRISPQVWAEAIEPLRAGVAAAEQGDQLESSAQIFEFFLRIIEALGALREALAAVRAAPETLRRLSAATARVRRLAAGRGRRPGFLSRPDADARSTGPGPSPSAQERPFGDFDTSPQPATDPAPIQDAHPRHRPQPDLDQRGTGPGPSATAEVEDDPFAGTFDTSGGPVTNPEPIDTVDPRTRHVRVSEPQLLAAYEQVANESLPDVVRAVRRRQRSTRTRRRLAVLRQQFDELRSAAGEELTAAQRTRAMRILREARRLARRDFNGFRNAVNRDLRRVPSVRAAEARLREAGDASDHTGGALRIRVRLRDGEIGYESLNLEHRVRLTDNPWLYNDPGNLIVTDGSQNQQYLEAIRRAGGWTNDAIEDFVIRHRLNSRGIDQSPGHRPR